MLPGVSEKTVKYLIAKGWNIQQFERAQDITIYSPDINPTQVVPIVEIIPDINEALVLADLIIQFDIFSPESVIRSWQIFAPDESQVEYTANECRDFLETLKNLLNEVISLDSETIIATSIGLRMAIRRIQEKQEQNSILCSRILHRIMDSIESNTRDIQDIKMELEERGIEALEQYMEI